MPDGIILVDKASGPSSAQVVAVLRRVLKERRIGHCGTLDPMASGLLVCLVGRATRLARYAEAGNKTYSGVIRWGIESDSDDVTGKITSSAELRPSSDDLESARKAFIGEQMQIPPAVSAVKIAGERAYRRVRRGESVDIKPRGICIYEFDLEQQDRDRASFRVVCSKGTYIRSLARDVGRLLGCGGALERLRRERSEPFSVAQAKAVDDVKPGDILDWSILFPKAARVALNTREAAGFARGDERVLEVLRGQGIPLVCVDQEHHSPLGLVVGDKGKLRFGAIM